MSDSDGSFAAGLGSMGPSDRRASVRYELGPGSAGKLLANVEGTSCSVRIKNLSTGGLAFEADRRIEPHTLLTVELPSQDEFGSRTLAVRVRSVEVVSPGVWIISCELSRPLSSLELLALL
jgi:PilZ domain